MRLSIIIVICFLGSFVSAQNKGIDLSFEFQAYPTGLIPGIKLSKTFNDIHAVYVKPGYNWLRHRDLGKHDDERGDGYGVTLGYRRYFESDYQDWFVGIRSDYWHNTVDWKDFNNTVEIEGTTVIDIIQPTIEGGYLFINENNWFFAPSLALGFEINFKTQGAPTGEGAIVLAGFSIGKRF